VLLSHPGCVSMDLADWAKTEPAFLDADAGAVKN
jgi:hypothetical protein